MRTTEKAPEKPRKRPVQARSQVTVAAIFEASLQVLLADGYRKLTTTRVAERAGVSIGTLYQYFPNRQALVAAMIEDYLDDLSTAFERECRPLMQRSLDDLVIGLVDAIIAAKCRRLDVSSGLQEPLMDIRGAALVKAASNRAAAIVAEVLTSCRDADVADVPYAADLIVTSCRALLQGAIADGAGPAELDKLRTHLRAMVRGYLERVTSRDARASA